MEPGTALPLLRSSQLKGNSTRWCNI